jgi:hypothetical protein
MPNRNRELWASLIAIVFITLVYLLMVAITGRIPAAGEFYGHAMGVLGFLLMVMTETLYTLRKHRPASGRWGRMASWLQFHIFTGLVGPYLVLLHSSWKFNGVAGVLTLLTLMIVLSGFVGRYIYTAVPRTADGIEVRGEELELQIAATEAELQRLTAARTGNLPTQPSANLAVFQTSAETAEGGLPWLVGRNFQDLQSRLAWWWSSRRLDTATRAQVRQLEGLVRRRNLLRRQVASLASVRRMLAIWHLVHIPIGLGLFSLALVHVGAAIYYALLLH